MFLYYVKGAGLFLYGYLTDVALLTANNPSLGAIIGLAHTLAPSIPGRFGGHLHQLSPWGVCLSLTFDGFQEQLQAAKPCNETAELHGDDTHQRQVRVLPLFRNWIFTCYAIIYLKFVFTPIFIFVLIYIYTCYHSLTMAQY